MKYRHRGLHPRVKVVTATSYNDEEVKKSINAVWDGEMNVVVAGVDGGGTGEEGEIGGGGVGEEGVLEVEHAGAAGDGSVCVVRTIRNISQAIRNGEFFACTTNQIIIYVLAI